MLIYIHKQYCLLYNTIFIIKSIVNYFLETGFHDGVMGGKIEGFERIYFREAQKFKIFQIYGFFQNRHMINSSM